MAATANAGSGYYGATAVLLVVAGAAWLVLTDGVPLVLITRHGTGSALAGITGTWFLWTVAPSPSRSPSPR